jgi:hypothetical protein
MLLKRKVFVLVFGFAVLAVSFALQLTEPKQFLVKLQSYVSQFKLLTLNSTPTLPPCSM